MKLFSPVPFMVCSLILVVGSFSGASKATAEPTAVAPSSAIAQDSAQANDAAPRISGKWQVSWTASNGNQRQATLAIKQHGNKLSGTFQAGHSSTSMKGSLDGARVLFNAKLPKREISFTGTVDGDNMNGTTEHGAPWTATRE
ncbi:MAG: hypothetical protein WBQ94_01925 [Terracidiphilus sp.]